MLISAGELGTTGKYGQRRALFMINNLVEIFGAGWKQMGTTTFLKKQLVILGPRLLYTALSN
jgi:hypothetical protein